MVCCSPGSVQRAPHGLVILAPSGLRSASLGPGMVTHTGWQCMPSRNGDECPYGPITCAHRDRVLFALLGWSCSLIRAVVPLRCDIAVYRFAFSMRFAYYHLFVFLVSSHSLPVYFAISHLRGLAYAAYSHVYLSVNCTLLIIIFVFFYVMLPPPVGTNDEDCLLRSIPGSQDSTTD